MNDQMIPCSEVMRRLWAFIDDELDTASAAEVKRHLEMCRRCYPRYNFQFAYFKLMQRSAEKPEPGELRSQVFQRLLAETG